MTIDFETDTPVNTFRDQLRQVLNIVFAIAQAVSPFFADIAGIGQPIWTRSDIVETPATPATYTFFIWLFIFVTCIGYSVYQSLPSRRNDPFLRSIGFFTATAFFGSTLWEIDNQLHGVNWLSVVLIIFVLFTIGNAFVEVVRRRASLTNAERWFVALPVSVFTGWESIATFAVISQALEASGFDYFGLSQENFSIMTVIVAGIFGTIITFLSRGNWYCGLAIIWALIGIVFNNITSQQNTAVAVTASGMAMLVAITLLGARMIDKDRRI
ncbi:hypothetical protein [Nostoc sp. MG11]|uniref:hypothetical protein n=1 Tax=Nostoc sp. MG11 TaxID=2721166 RepID=UPI001865DBDB|nr:hypothetical protein [Nostoc sp. MG11]